MRELGLLDADEGLSTTFEDVEALAESCRFSDCRHGNEPGCAVRAALESGALDPGRWKSFGSCRGAGATSSARRSPDARQAYLRRWMPIIKAQRAAHK